MRSCAWTSSPASRCSATRTAFFTGSRYTPVLLSGKIDVRHEVAPTVTATRTEPKPRRLPAVRSVISELIPAGSETKCQPPAPGYCHSGAANSKLPTRVTGRHYGAPPTEPPYEGSGGMAPEVTVAIAWRTKSASVPGSIRGAGIRSGWLEEAHDQKAWFLAQLLVLLGIAFAHCFGWERLDELFDEESSTGGSRAQG